MARLGLLGSFAEIKDRTRNRRSVSNENPFHCYFKESRRAYLPFLGLSLRFHGFLVIDLDVVIIVSHGVFDPLSVLWLQTLQKLWRYRLVSSGWEEKIEFHQTSQNFSRTLRENTSEIVASFEFFFAAVIWILLIFCVGSLVQVGATYDWYDSTATDSRPLVLTTTGLRIGYCKQPSASNIFLHCTPCQAHLYISRIQ